MLIGGVSEGRVLHRRYEREVTRLAGGIMKTGRLDEKAVEKTVKILKGYSEIIRNASVTDVLCVGTSALREAENSMEFLLQARHETGLDVKVITGDEEARLTALGVLSSLELVGDVFLADIGGGSTEIILIREGRIAESFSAPIGVVKLLESHIKTDPPSGDELRRLDMDSEKAANEMRERVERISGDTSFVATAGTATTLASIDLGLSSYDRNRVHGHKISIERLYEMSNMLTSLKLEERRRLRGLESSRADLIITGIKLTIKIMEILGVHSVLISDDGLLEGALLKLSQEAHK
jgi:exopolyphosphatase/guanosine-5'-triphosphate,3'-diphosphate pyrophosphatase